MRSPRWSSGGSREKAGRDPRAIMRTVNVGFHMGADARGAARHEALLRAQRRAELEPRQGFLRGTRAQVIALIGASRDAGVEPLDIALRQGPHDGEALHARTEVAVPASGIKRPG